MNKEFKSQSYNILYWLIEEGKIDSDQLFDFLELYWPTFIEIDGYIFLKEKFNEDEYKRLVSDKINPEFWINFLTVDDFFIDSEKRKKDSLYFSKRLSEIWAIKLVKDFPEFEITVKCLEDDESGDYGLTFYQTKNQF